MVVQGFVVFSYIESRKVHPVPSREWKKLSREVPSALGFYDYDMRVQMAPCVLGTLGMNSTCGSEPKLY